MVAPVVAAGVLAGAYAVLAAAVGYFVLKKFEERRGHVLTLAEEAYFVTHLTVFRKTVECANKAYVKEQEIFGSGGGLDDEGDAFRHCYWSALLTREVGAGSSGDVTSLHEQIPDNPSKDMDLWNNAAGRIVISPNPDDNIMAYSVLQTLIAGRLKVMTPTRHKMDKAKAWIEQFSVKLGTPGFQYSDPPPRL